MDVGKDRRTCSARLVLRSRHTFNAESNLLEAALLEDMLRDVAVLDVLEESIQSRRVDDCSVEARGRDDGMARRKEEGRRCKTKR